jgi:predicted Co/Zn/Cd cation transporter (cation efflux family)
MAERDFSKQKKGLVAIDGAMALIVLLVIVQIWLLSAALEALLAGHTETALPAAVFSFLLFLGCVALTLLVWRVDRDSRDS